jgi:manganese/zinc/iron transport system permease protein
LFDLSYNTQMVLIGTTLLGAVSGIIGCYMVLRKRALIGDTLAHSALPGLCLAFMIFQTKNFIGLLGGAFLTALAGAWLVSAIRRHTRIKEDAAIGIVLSFFFGMGVVLLSIIQDASRFPGSNKAGIHSFILGKTAGMVVNDIYLIIVSGLIVLLIVLLLYKEFRLLSFDPDFARVQGWPVLGLDMLMMSLVCLTTIIGLPAVGVVLMVAMLIMPGASARFWTDGLTQMIVLAAIFGMITSATGTMASAWFPNLPAGAIIIICGSFIFLVSMICSPKRGLLARLVRRMRLQKRVAEQNLLRTVYELSEPDWPQPPLLQVADLTRLRAWSNQRAEKLLDRACNRGWVEGHSNRGYRLTDGGWHQAAMVVKAHRLWEIFLIEEAHVAPAHVDRDAESLEHVLPPDLIRRLEQRLIELGLLPLPLQPIPRRHKAMEVIRERP